MRPSTFKLRLLATALGLLACFSYARAQSEVDTQVKKIRTFTDSITGQVPVMTGHMEALIKLRHENPRGTVGRKKYEAVFRAGKAIRAGTEVGVAILKYRDLVQSFATEVAIIKGQAANGAERNLTETYGHVLGLYVAASTVWSAKLEFAEPDTELSKKAEKIIQLAWADAGHGLDDAEALYLGTSRSSPSPTKKP